jgi:hypothetical protein
MFHNASADVEELRRKTFMACSMSNSVAHSFCQQPPFQQDNPPVSYYISHSGQLFKLPTMFIKTLFSFLLLVVAFCVAQRDAMEDIQVGMQGLKEAVKDPALLAQLIRDMQVIITG